MCTVSDHVSLRNRDGQWADKKPHSKCRRLVPTATTMPPQAAAELWATLTATITVAVMTQVLAAGALTPGGWRHNCFLHPLWPLRVPLTSGVTAGGQHAFRLSGWEALSGSLLVPFQLSKPHCHPLRIFVPLVTDETVSESKDFGAPLQPDGDRLWGWLLSL